MNPQFTNLKQWKYTPLVDQIKSAPLVNEKVLTILRLFVIGHARHLKPTEYADIMLFLDHIDVFLNMNEGTHH